MVKTVCLGIDVPKLNKNKSNFKKNKIVSLQKHEVSHNTIWLARATTLFRQSYSQTFAYIS